MRKKTLPVSVIRERANALLANDNHFSSDFRSGVAALLEGILTETGQYRGFNFLPWLNGGYAQWEAAGKPEDRDPYIGDQTRRVYF